MKSTQLPIAPGETILTETFGRCPICRVLMPTQIVRTPGLAAGAPDRVVGRRLCPEHGLQESLFASNARWYFVPPESGKSCGASCGCRSADGAKPADLGGNFAKEGLPADDLASCVTLFHIIEGCNLACPTCFASAPRGSSGAIPIEDFEAMVNRAVAKKGDLEIAMLTGGEPTFHPQFLDMLRFLKGHSGVQYTIVNTNGVWLAADKKNAQAIGEIFPRPGGGCQIYLQYDGPQESGQRELRGFDARSMRERALRYLAEAKVPATLAMTATPANRGHLWETFGVALGNEWVHGVTFQPEFSSGRGPEYGDRLTAACVIDGVIAQSGGLLTERSIVPLPCGHPNCTFVGYVLRKADGVLEPVFDRLPMDRLTGYLRDSFHYTLSQIAQCGCDRTELGTLLHGIEGGLGKVALGDDVARVLGELRSGGRLVRLVVKPFMGAESYDARRVGMCCTHVFDGENFVSFCDYYGAWPQG